MLGIYCPLWSWIVMPGIWIGKWSVLWCVRWHARIVRVFLDDHPTWCCRENRVVLKQCCKLTRSSVSESYTRSCSMWTFWHLNGIVSKNERRNITFTMRSHHQCRNSFALLPFWCEACDMNYFVWVNVTNVHAYGKQTQTIANVKRRREIPQIFIVIKSWTVVIRFESKKNGKILRYKVN